MPHPVMPESAGSNGSRWRGGSRRSRARARSPGGRASRPGRRAGPGAWARRGPRRGERKGARQDYRILAAVTAWRPASVAQQDDITFVIVEVM